MTRAEPSALLVNTALERFYPGSSITETRASRDVGCV